VSPEQDAADLPASLAAAAEAIDQAHHLILSAGAGMGVDSGLPDFRGDEGFWNAYPPFRALGLSFAAAANPRWFLKDPGLAWGFYGHRADLYRRTEPHEGFAILRRWQTKKVDRGFVFTSNVDGQFAKAGFDEASTMECHGSIHHLQCSRPCANVVWPSQKPIVIDEETMRAASPYPMCTKCRAIARPAILMFGDGSWVSRRTDAQENRLAAYLNKSVLADTTIIELGAGTAVPTVRSFGERLRAKGAKLVRVNLRQSEGPAGTLSVPLGAKDALLALDELLGHPGR
jgi:NAD-dependent SIR2 family protein deacetylase